MMEETNKVDGRRKRDKAGGEDGIRYDAWIFATENLEEQFSGRLRVGKVRPISKDRTNL